MSRTMPRPDESRAQGRRLFEAAPLVIASIVAWWTTVRPSWLAIGGVSRSWILRGALVVWTVLGITVAALGVVNVVFGAAVSGDARVDTPEPLRSPVEFRRYVVFSVLVGFVVPAAVTWLVGPESATALGEPVELFVGAVAWTALGIVLVRPQSVSAPRGAEGGKGPAIGAGDDVARVSMKEFDVDSLYDDAPQKLVPRQRMPRLASLPLWVASALAVAIGYQAMRIGTNMPDRAILARIVGAGIAIALVGTAGDLVQVRYTPRTPPPPPSRLRRALVSLAILAVLACVGLAAMLRDG